MMLFWNVRGINDPRKQRSLQKSLLKFHGSIVCLLETHVKEDSFMAISSKLFPGWQVTANYKYAQLGRIWVACDQSIRMEVMSESAQALHCHIYSIQMKAYFFLTIVY